MGRMDSRPSKSEGESPWLRMRNQPASSSMPQSAIAAGCVDFIGSPEAYCQRTHQDQSPSISPTGALRKRRSVTDGGVNVSRKFWQILRVLQPEDGRRFHRV